jgi:hypothetical protein
LKSTAGKFGDVKLLAALDIEALHDLARQDEPVGVTDSFDFDFHGTTRQNGVIRTV